jgi:CubicO group peptidase (beta-lactamase class C family)
LPDCKAVNATLRQLLTHTSGIPAGLPAEPAWQGKAAAYALACSTPPTHAAGTFFRYSDIGFVLLGAIVEKVSGEPFDTFVVRRVWQPLGMKSTYFSPLDQGVDKARIAPTQRQPTAGEWVGAPGGQAKTEKTLHPDLLPGQELRGVVHDPTVRRMGGAAGSAGAFSTTSDIARFARMMLAGGELDGVRVLKKETVAAMTQVQTSEAAYWRRGLGFDIDSPYSRPRGAILPLGSYGHTGFTGCILWIDPFSKTFYVFLSNRVYPADQSNILTLYTQLGNAVARTVQGFDFQNVPGALKAKDPLPPG